MNRALVILFLCSLSSIFLGTAKAHPKDEVVQGAYLTIAPNQILLELDIMPGNEVVEPFLKSLDSNGNHFISEIDASDFAAMVLQQSSISLDGTLEPWHVDHVTTTRYETFAIGTAVLKIYASAKRVESAGLHTLVFENNYVPAKSQRIANVFLRPTPQLQYRVDSQHHSDDGHQLSVNYTVSHP